MIFRREDILLEYADKYLKSVIKSLRNDVLACLTPHAPIQQAPFTALLPCFSVLGLLSSLYYGNARPSPKTTEQMKGFLIKYFPFGKVERDLILNIYRHKLVHIFQPAPVFIFKHKTFSWRIFHDDPMGLHLKIESRKRLFRPFPSVTIRVNNIFSIVINKFLEEIEDSSVKYFEDLKTNRSLMVKFDRALCDIYTLKRN